MEKHAAIEINPLRCNGKPVIAGTRIPVTVILDQLAEVGSVDELLRKYPEVTKDQVLAVLEYCRSIIDHSDLEMVPA